MLAKLAKWTEDNIKWIFTIPAVLFVLFMIAFPIAYTFRISFFEWSMSNVTPPKFVGLSNYTKLITDERFLASTFRTILFSAAALTIEVVLGFIIALLLNKKIAPKFTRTAMLIPMIATPVAVGMVWMLIFEPTIGGANLLLKSLGLPTQLWLASANQALMSLIIVDIWEWTPMVALIVLAGLTALPSEPYESAKVDGASSWQMLWKITLPLIKPTVMVVALIRLIDVLKTFDIIFSTTQGGPKMATETMNVLGYILSFQYFAFGEASALIMLFFALVMVISIIFVGIKNKSGVEY